MDGAIFFRSRSVKVRRFGAWCGRLSSPVSPLPHHHLRPAGRGLCLVIFFLSPFPLPSALLFLRVSINPPPPGVGCANERAVCGCGLDGGLLASVLCSCRSLACARSLLSRLRFGFSFLGSPRFSDLLGRVSFACVGSRSISSLRIPRPVHFLLRPVGVGFPPLVAHAFRPLSALLVSCLASPCPAVPLPDCRSACFARLSCVAASWRSCFVSPFSPPCLSYDGAAWSAVPRGRSFLGCWSSRSVPAPCLPCLLSRLGIVRDGCRGGACLVVRACLLRAACFLASARALAV